MKACEVHEGECPSVVNLVVEASGQGYGSAAFTCL